MPSDQPDSASHPLVQTLLDNVKPLIIRKMGEVKKAPHNGEVGGNAQLVLWPSEQYDWDVFTHVSSLVHGLERLGQTETFIRKFPLRRSYEREGINQHTWIEYHYSYYVITVVSLFDIALLLANSVFRLGNREQDCKADIILKNYWVAATQVKQALKSLDQLVTPHREKRNLHVHRGRMPDVASVLGSELLKDLGLFSFLQMVSEPILDREILDRAYKGEVTEICQKLREETSTLQNSIWQVFDQVLPVYAKKTLELREELRLAAAEELERRRKLQEENPEKKTND